MAQFDVHIIDGGYILDCQSDLLSGLATRLVAPLLVAEDAPKSAARLNPIFEVSGTRCVMMTQYMAAVPAKLIGKPLTSLIERRTEIIGAVDFLLAGC